MGIKHGWTSRFWTNQIWKWEGWRWRFCSSPVRMKSDPNLGCIPISWGVWCSTGCAHNHSIIQIYIYIISVKSHQMHKIQILHSTWRLKNNSDISRPWNLGPKTKPVLVIITGKCLPATWLVGSKINMKSAETFWSLGPVVSIHLMVAVVNLSNPPIHSWKLIGMVSTKYSRSGGFSFAKPRLS